MIFYFSGVGNSKWIAEELSKQVTDQTFDISSLSQTPDITNEEFIGFVFPIYAWAAPEVMIDFIKELPQTNAFTYAIATCGEDSGKALKVFNKLYPLQSSYSISMPNTYITGSELEEESIINQKIINAKQFIETIKEQILSKTSVYQVNEGPLAAIKTNLLSFGFNRFARDAKPFYATDACISCNLCATQCPSKTITMDNGTPTWKTQCYLCMRCIHQCPTQAIEYGSKTKGKKRYILKSYL